MPGAHRLHHLGTLALAALLALSGCYARRPVPSDPPEEAAVVSAEPAAAKLPAKPAPAPAPAAKAAPRQEEPSAPVTLAEDAAEAPVPLATTAAQAVRLNYVQIAAFATEGNAQGAVARLNGAGFDATRLVRVEQEGKVMFRVQAGPFQDLAATHKALETLKADWPQAFIPVD
ncbi:MAG: SPOR domain-containing protein [Proteobacteria bacterium]|nr:SPOR domain-containing protein [Pseudomonadota bacterium]MBU1596374.1 SPOR domain-containing protein [Pseudomonadota bacterium]